MVMKNDDDRVECMRAPCKADGLDSILYVLCHVLEERS